MNSKTQIPGGYILLSRKLIESEIWKKPPLYLKVWIYLLSKAQHKDYKGLKRGQLWTSIPEIQEECSWYVGYRKVTPTKDQVYQVIEWLRNPNGKISRNPYESNYESNDNTTMITTTKATQGMIIDIVNYNVYQDSRNYESNNEGNDENDTKAIREQRLPNNINKNVKNDNNNKNDNINTTCVDSEESPPLKYDEDSVYYQVALYLRKKILEFNPKCKVPDSNPKALEKWSDTIRLTMERDKRTIDEMREIVQFIFKDDFWCTVVQSPANLRKNWDKIWSKMKVSNKTVKSKTNSNLSKLEEMYLKAKAEEEGI